MDYAWELIRSVARSFYQPELVLIIDAVLQHSALRDDDLAVLMGSNPKHIRKLCIKLRDDGLLNVHSRPEIRQGANKAINRDYYFINFHHAIDVIKYRIKSMKEEVEKRFGQGEDEKKEYFCDRCKSEYTQMEVLDTVRPDGQFACKKCGNILRQDYEQKSVGHEIQSRLNDQMAAFERLMRKIDDVQVPENDFEAAIANAKPVQRDSSLNPVVPSQVAPPRGNMPAATVYGMKTEQEKVQVSLYDEAQAKKDAEAEAERKAKLAEQNALPSWYTTSTISGDQTALGMREEAARREREADTFVGSSLSNGDTEEEKKPVEALQENSQLNAYFAALQEDERKRQQEEEEEEDSDDEDDDDDQDDFEDVAIDSADGRPPNKRVKIEEPGQNPPPSNGITSLAGDDSVAASASTSTGNSTPLTVAAATAAANQKTAPANGTPKEDSGEDSDEDEFEDVEV